MSKRGNHARAIQPETLQTPEDGLDLVDRNPGPVEVEPESLDVGAELEARILAARKLTPAPGIGCRDCWRRGRDAALARVAGAAEAKDVLARLEEARVLRPSPKEMHWLECWEDGRDAAVAAIEED